MKNPFPAHYFAQDAMGGQAIVNPRLVYAIMAQLREDWPP
jgi:hypothetical protein